ncbi:MAG: phosphoribosylanthranilate isomerase [Chloroflexi bacterium]|nr:phosphoribosylanthranilate isomerase [Chloroflexota bacterium]
MIVQIYTAQTPEEGVALAKLGVDHIGVTPSSAGLPGEISPGLARKIFDALPPRAVKVALSVDTDAEKIAQMVKIVKPDILQLCGEIKVMNPEKVAALRQILPAVQIMQAIPVIDREAVRLALSFQEVADYLILDSFSKEIGGIGAAGFTHDWGISREIVQISHLPVILAGGLSPENVAEAIRIVQPWGVDSLTCTNLQLGGGRFIKDLVRVRSFVDHAHQASQDLKSG